VAFIVLGLVLAVGGGFWYLDRQARNIQPPQSVLTPEAKAYVASYHKKFGEAPSSIYGVLAGDGFRVVAKAIEASKSTKAAALREYLVTGLKAFPGFTGKIEFNAKGDRVGELYRVYKVAKDGSFVLQP
jgi:branched-chain amino acid transport system substrate-binding protein